MISLLVTIFLAPFLYLLLFIIISRNYNGTVAQKYFTVFLSTSFIWVLISNFEIYNISLGLYNFLYHLDFGLPPLIAYFFILFVLHFPANNQKVKKSHQIGLSLPIIVVSLLGFSGAIFNIIGKGHLEYNHALYYFYFSILFIYFVILGMGIMVKKYSSSVGIARFQILYLIIGYSISIVLLLFVSLFPVIQRPLNVRENIVANTFAIFFMLGSSVAIFRYRLMDIRVVIRKGLVQFVTFTILFGIYAYFVLFFQQQIAKFNNFSSELTLIFSVMLVAFTVESFRKLIYKNVDSLFTNMQKKEMLALQKVRMLSQSISHISELVNEVTTELQSVFPYYTISILVRNNDGILRPKSGVEFSIDGLNILVERVREKKDIIITDELPYTVQYLNKSEKELEFKIEQTLREKNIRAVLAFGLENDVSAVVFLHSKNLKQPLFKENIHFLKFFHLLANSAIVQAEMYKMAVARAVESNLEE